MDILTVPILIMLAISPLMMIAVSLTSLGSFWNAKSLWRFFYALTSMALISTLLMVLIHALKLTSLSSIETGWWLTSSKMQIWMAFLVQLLGTVIGIFSSRYLEGEANQVRYIRNFCSLLASVHILLLANHWMILIIAWASIGFFLESLLCFYSERPFAMLAAHKKFIADRLADLLLIAAAALAWSEVGSGFLSDLANYMKHHDIGIGLNFSALFLVVAVILRTALLPVHGWLIQVMEAPTPVSAILHAGVINLGGFVLIRFAPLLNQAYVAKWVLIIFGFVTALLAGLVMLTRVSIKVRLAWSTVAQMGFMILECGLGLYSLAAMHLIGHSLYKAHTFLAASSVVEQYKIEKMSIKNKKSILSLILAPVIAVMIVSGVQTFFAEVSWPNWWTVILGFAWAPILWVSGHQFKSSIINLGAGFMMVIGLTLLATLLQLLDFGTEDLSNQFAGNIVMFGMMLMYVLLVLIQKYPNTLVKFQRWSYAGFYLDEYYTRLTLKLWPINWASTNKISSKE